MPLAGMVSVPISAAFNIHGRGGFDTNDDQIRFTFDMKVVKQSVLTMTDPGRPDHPIGKESQELK